MFAFVNTAGLHQNRTPTGSHSGVNEALHKGGRKGPTSIAPNVAPFRNHGFIHSNELICEG